jgi:parvulin-like peptidyl-prolyl isomerase
VRVSDADVREAVERDLVRLRLRFAAARPGEIRGSLELAPEEVRAFAEAQPARVEQAYQQRRGEFQVEEAVRARHLLLRGENAQGRARQALDRIRGGEDFARVAKEVSEDLATREEGGDLGFFPRGRMATAFEEAAFSLEIAKVSEPVETEHGWHLIEVTERRPASARPLEEVRDALAEALLRDDRSRARAREQADALAARLRAGEDFQAAAAAVGLEVQETPVFHPSERMVPGIGLVPGVLDEALALTKERSASPTVFETADGYLLIALLDREEPDAAAVSAALPSARERLELEARMRLQQTWYRARRDALQRDGRIQFFDASPQG